MPSTASIAIRKVTAYSEILQRLELMKADVPELKKSYRNKPLAEVLKLEQINDALASLVELPEVIEAPEIEVTTTSSTDEEITVQTVEEEEVDPDLEELEDMNSEELRLYADNMGVSYPHNISDEVLRKKLILARGN